MRVEDNDLPTLVLSTANVRVTEGSSVTFTVRLGMQPSGQTTVRLASNHAQINLNRGALTFTPSNWNTPQSVRVSAPRDSHPLEDTASISLTGSGVINTSVSVTVLEATEAYRNHNFITVNEGTSTATFQYKLDSRPAGNRTITMTTSHADLTLAAGTGGAPSRNLTLTFTPSNWSTPQTVTASAAHDSDAADYIAYVDFTLGPGLAHRGGVSERLRVLMRDDDIGLTLSGSPLSVGEDGTATFTVKLASRPAGGGIPGVQWEIPEAYRVVNLTSSNPDVTISPSQLTFTGRNEFRYDDGNWNIPQTITVRRRRPTAMPPTTRRRSASPAAASSTARWPSPCWSPLPHAETGTSSSPTRAPPRRPSNTC